MQSKLTEQPIVPKDPIKTLRYLKAVFLAVVGSMLLLIAATPFLVPRRIALFDRFVFEENAIEAVLILFLFALAYLASRAYRTAVSAYKKRLRRLAADRSVLADRLTDAFRYIGTVNVQLQEIRSVFSGLKRLPENRRQFKDLMGMFGGKILGMMNVDWVTIRIVDRRTLRTIVEHREVRKTQPVANPHIGNRAIVEGKPAAGCVIVTDAKDNLSIVAACILPLDHLDKEETILMQALVDEIEMLFIISNLYPAVKDDFFTNEAGSVSTSGSERSDTDY
jgi:hypothetical protein